MARLDGGAGGATLVFHARRPGPDRLLGAFGFMPACYHQYLDSRGLSVRFWLDLFTGTTWDEFHASGASVSGFSARKRNTVERIKKGDVLLCYMTGVMRWVGALEVLGPSTDKSAIWKDAEFPVRLAVKPLVKLSAEHGIPMEELVGKVDFYATAALKGKFKGFLRGSPAEFKRQDDGKLILDLMRAAERNPVARPVDAKLLARKPRGFKVEFKKDGRKVPAFVTVPEPEEAPQVVAEAGQETASTTRHTEIQAALLSLGAEMGLDVWVASNDRSKLFGGKKLGEFPRVVEELPTQFNDATTRTIELIDVLWLKGNSIAAAFEVESTTSIYSGLLRMSDLLALQPNIDIRLYLVAPEERRDKVAQEIRRPTFGRFEKPLPDVCGFLPFNKLQETVDGARKLNLASSLPPSFLEKVAEYFNDDATD